MMADILGLERRKDKKNPEYQNLRKGIIPSGKKYKYGKPVRMLILEGKLPHTENGVVQDGEYSTMYDKSRYQFMLDAPFEVSAICCNVMKKAPIHKYADEMGRNPMTAQMASESSLRTKQWLTNGCNGFDMKRPISNPMAFWTEQDVLLYIYQNHLPICSVYGDVVKDTEVEGQLDLEDIYGKELFDLGRPLLKTTGCNRTGCMFCGYGCQFKGDKRFERMKVTHPKQYEYIMKPQELGGLGYKAVIDWINEHGNMDIRY